ncbi:MAG TPA: hypothetical protein VF263_20090 [Longimicrobiaceae bacterium]
MRVLLLLLLALAPAALRAQGSTGWAALVHDGEVGMYVDTARFEPRADGTVRVRTRLDRLAPPAADDPAHAAAQLTEELDCRGGRSRIVEVVALDAAERPLPESRATGASGWSPIGDDVRGQGLRAVCEVLEARRAGGLRAEMEARRNNGLATDTVPDMSTFRVWFKQPAVPALASPARAQQAWIDYVATKQLGPSGTDGVSWRTRVISGNRYEVRMEMGSSAVADTLPLPERPSSARNGTGSPVSLGRPFGRVGRLHADSSRAGRAWFPTRFLGARTLEVRLGAGDVVEAFRLRPARSFRTVSGYLGFLHGAPDRESDPGPGSDASARWTRDGVVYELTRRGVVVELTVSGRRS